MRIEAKTEECGVDFKLLNERPFTCVVCMKRISVKELADGCDIPDVFALCESCLQKKTTEIMRAKGWT